MVSLIWKLIKVWGGKLIELFYRLVKAQLRALLWKWGAVVVMVVGTLLLALYVLN